jgi:hypothetical protein
MKSQKVSDSLLCLRDKVFEVIDITSSTSLDTLHRYVNIVQRDFVVYSESFIYCMPVHSEYN